MSHFKSQQELMKYVADGGAVTNKDCNIVKFDNGFLVNFLKLPWSFDVLEDWSPYVIPKPKTKVWSWERITTSSSGTPCIYESNYYYTEDDAANYLAGYTKVAGSEREI